MAQKLTKAQRRIFTRAGFARGTSSKSGMTLKKDDVVLVRAGADRGRQGKIIEVLRDQNRVIVENIAMVTRHQRRRPGVLQSETVEKAAPIHRAKVMLICPDCERPTRIAHTTLPGGQKVRSCKHCDATLDKD